ncbi:hypothetical protein ACFX11_034555 [Malus domestica]
MYPTGRAKTMFASGISVGDVSWPTSAQLPRRLAPVEGCCRALSGKAYRARLVKHGLSGKAGREGQR